MEDKTITLGKLLCPLMPVSKSRRKAYLKRVESAVSIYKPRIEERTGISLGDVEVKEYCELRKQFFKKEIPEIINKLIEKQKINTRIGKAIYGGIFSAIGNSFISVYSLISEEITEMSCAYSTIYVPFGLSRKLGFLLNEFSGIDNTDTSVVHELSHILWDRLEDHNQKEQAIRKHKSYKSWGEGFATYCENILFADFYPKEYKWESYHYRRDMLKVKGIVNEFGESILLKIPSKWQEIDHYLDNGEKIRAKKTSL